MTMSFIEWTLEVTATVLTVVLFLLFAMQAVKTYQRLAAPVPMPRTAVVDPVPGRSSR